MSNCSQPTWHGSTLVSFSIGEISSWNVSLCASVTSSRLGGKKTTVASERNEQIETCCTLSDRKKPICPLQVQCSSVIFCYRRSSRWLPSEKSRLWVQRQQAVHQSDYPSWTLLFVAQQIFHRSTLKHWHAQIFLLIIKKISFHPYSWV